jgi:hypothetical protein
MLVIDQGEIPVDGVADIDLVIPGNESLIGFDIHLQALTGEGVTPPVNAQLTNRQILTVLP